MACSNDTDVCFGCPSVRVESFRKYKLRNIFIWAVAADARKGTPGLRRPTRGGPGVEGRRARAAAGWRRPAQRVVKSKERVPCSLEKSHTDWRFAMPLVMDHVRDQAGKTASFLALERALTRSGPHPNSTCCQVIAALKDGSSRHIRTHTRTYACGTSSDLRAALSRGYMHRSPRRASARVRAWMP